MALFDQLAQRTVARLSEQLRRYLDDQAWLENRRIMQLIREVEQHALALRDLALDGDVMALDEPAPRIDLPMDRPLFAPPFRPRIVDDAPVDAAEEISAQALFEQTHVDKLKLTAQIRRALQTRSQISLAELVEAHPVEQGLAELVTYLTWRRRTAWP